MVWKQPQLTDPPMGPTAEIQLAQHRLLRAFNGNSQAVVLGVTESGIFDAATDKALRNIQAYWDGKSTAAGTFRNTEPGVLNYETKLALGVVVPVKPPPPPLACVGLTVGGAGSAYNNGYQWDLGEALDHTRCYHQPVGFNTNPFPMNTGVQDGVTEFVRQLNMPRFEFGGRNCSQIPWFTPLAYSMGSIVWMIVLMRVLHGDLQQFKSTYMGSNSFGNPARQKDHAFPGAIPVSGEGIAWFADVHDVPECHWDFTARKGMLGSPGNDLYADVEGSTLTVKDMRAVWDIVNKGLSGVTSLATAVLALLAHPSFDGGYSAAVAAFKALDFFVVKGLTPHTSYQFVQPIAGDPRDCWRIALDHSNDIVARLPLPFA